MKHLLKIEKFINQVLNEEALPLKLAKEYTAMGSKRSPLVQTKLDTIMGNKKRIYLPIIEEVESPVQTEIGWFLSSVGYTIADYIQGSAFQNDNPKRQVRIGKLLSQNKKTELLQKFNMDPIRQLAGQGSKTQYSVVISQHPYDIAGMSCGTGREAWHSSCLNAISGANRRYLPGEIQRGTLVAYLIKSEDTNIEKPLGRVNIKPYCDNSGCVSSMYWFPDTRLYGNFSPAAMMALKEWIVSWQGVKTGEFFKTEGCYNYSGTAYVIDVSEDGDSFIVEDAYDTREDYEPEDDDYYDEDEDETEYDIDWFMDNDSYFTQLGNYIMAAGGTGELDIDDWENENDEINYIEFILPSFTLIDRQDTTAPYYGLRSTGFRYSRLSNISYASIKQINGDISVDYNYFIDPAINTSPKDYVYHCFQKMIEDNGLDLNGSFIEFKNFPDLRGTNDNREGLFMDFGNVDLNEYGMIISFVDCEKGFVLATLNNLAQHYTYHYVNEDQDSFKRITVQYTNTFKGEYFSVDESDNLSDYFKTRLLLGATMVEEDKEGEMKGGMKSPILKFVGFDFSKSIEYLKGATSDRRWFIENGLSDFLIPVEDHASVDDSEWFLKSKNDIFEGFKKTTDKEYVFTVSANKNSLVALDKVKEKGLEIPEGVISTLYLDYLSWPIFKQVLDVFPKDIRNIAIVGGSIGSDMAEDLSYFENLRGVGLWRTSLYSQRDLDNLPTGLKYLRLINLSIRDREGYSGIDKGIVVNLLSKISPEYHGYYLESLSKHREYLISSHTQQIPMVCLDELYDNIQPGSGPRKVLEDILGVEFYVIFSQYDRNIIPKIKLKEVIFNGKETCEVVVDYDDTKGGDLYHVPVKMNDNFIRSYPRLQAINNLGFPYKIDNYLGNCKINYFSPGVGIRPVSSFKNYPNVVVGDLEIIESGRENNPTLGTTHWEDPNFLKDFPKDVKRKIIFTTRNYYDKVDKLTEEQENDNIKMLADYLGLSFEETKEKVVFNNVAN